MADSLGYLHRIYPVQRIRSKKGDDESKQTVLTMGKKKIYFIIILNNRILNTFFTRWCPI